MGAKGALHLAAAPRREPQAPHRGRSGHLSRLSEANMDSNVTTVAFDQFKLEMAGKSCMVGCGFDL